MRRVLALVSLALLLGTPGALAAPAEYILPGGELFPEGVALRPGSDRFFVTSTNDGAVFRGRLGRERTRVFLAPGARGRTNAVGIEATRDRLIVAGGQTGTVFVYTCGWQARPPAPTPTGW